MSQNPPSEIQKLRVKLVATGLMPSTREQANLRVLRRASEEALAVASPASRPMEYLNALYEALKRSHFGQTA